MNLRFKKLTVFLFIIPIILAMGCSKSKNEKFDGYKLIEKRFVKELNADVYYFEHIKSGAHVVKIVTDDPNKTFAIAFKTEPNSNSGTPHIMEHSVLNGSKNFPVKSPFDQMSKTSLRTFLNAMTGSDATFYPVASMNKKDYFNLMTVYLDAVFFPLIYEDSRIFKQEGWHYELTDKDSPIIYKGVVYNEMKGSFSNPQRELFYQIDKNLFPDNGYGLSSGGYPMDIPKLSYEEFLDFHRQNYHPSNSMIMLYGDADMGEELKLIDEKYLSHFEKLDSVNEIQPQVPFDKMKDITASYSAIEGAPTEDQTFLSLNWVYGKGYDQSLALELDILADVLVNQESAPIRVALENAGIGKDVYAFNSADLQNTFGITVVNANQEDKEKFKEIVLSIMQEQAQKGLDKDAVEAYINSYEFYLREGNTPQKGLTAMRRSFSNWMFTKNPFAGLEWEKVIADVKTKTEQKVLEDLINTAFLNNNHALLMTLVPKPGLEKELNEIITNELADYKASLSDVELDSLVKETNELIAYQQREDDSANLAKLPKLGRDDIKKESEWYEVTEKDIDGSKILHYNDFTNDLVYVNLMFDLSVLPQELLPYASLLTNLIGKMDTKTYDYGTLEKEIMKNTGNLYSYLTSYEEDYKDENLIPQLVVVSKSVTDKTDKMFDLLNEVILTSKFDNVERLKTILTKHQSQLESSVKNRGLNYAMTRSFSYFSKKGMYNEITDGFEYYWFVNDLVANFDQNKDEIIANLNKTAELLFSQSTLITGVTCDEVNYSKFSDSYKNFYSQLPKTDSKPAEWSFELTKKNEGFMSASKVQYVVKAYNFKKQGYDWTGKLYVLDNILSSEYLQTQIRVIGGAYGGYSGISKNGTIYFASYRDPNLKETLVNYDSAVSYLNNFKADDETMLGYIIGAISNIDKPLTPSQKGSIAYRNYFTKWTKEKNQKDRDDLLSTNVEDIKQMSKMIADFLGQDNFCVYGNKEKIEANKDVFNNIMNTEKAR